MKKEDLILVLPVYNDMVELIIEGDENDGDYIDKTSLITLDEFEAILPILNKIENYEGDYSWANSREYLTKDERDKIYDYIPSGSDNSIHTVESIIAYFQSKSDGVRYEIAIEF